MNDLKSTYKKHLITITVVNLCVFWGAIFYNLDFHSINWSFESLTKTSFFVFVGPILSFVIGGWLSADLKTRLVFWRIANPLPGSRAFTRPILEDPRIDVNALKVKVGDFPTDPGEQNKVWYKLMKEEENDTAISQSHRDWLFARDLTGYSFIFLIILGPLAYLSVPNTLVMSVYILALVGQYLTVVFAGRTYGTRFVANVLAKVSSK